METKTFIGIDISSATLDICVSRNGESKSFIIGNEAKEVTRFFRKYNSKKVIVGMENTGRHNWVLYEALAGLRCAVYVIAPLHLKKSLGLVRGKNDKIDAVRIAAFIESNYTKLTIWKPASKAIQKLKVLLTERNRRIKIRKQMQVAQHDYSKMKKLGLEKPLLALSKKLITDFNNQITNIEKQIQQLIEQDESLKQQAELIQSVPGVGKVLCWTILAKTQGFTLIDDPRKMACYSGVVPFAERSGTSIRGRYKVSVYADKSLKSLLHLSSMSAIRLNNDLRVYYQRKVLEGKNKMSVLNAVRNKIIHRIYAVIKNQTPYSNSLVLS
jgi:transposase